MSLQTRIWHHFQESFLQKRKNLEGFFATEECKKVNFSTFAWFLSRNATFFALKHKLTFILGGKCKKWPKFTFLTRKKAFEIFSSPKVKIPWTTFKELGATLWLFGAKSDFCAKVVEFPPKIGKWGKWVPKDQENHYVYKGWRHGGGNVIFCSKS